MRSTRVTVGGVTFHGSDSQVDRVQGFVLVKFEGWNDAPSTRSEMVERPGDHGDFDLPVTRGARLVTMSGWCRARSEQKMGNFRSTLTGLLADGRVGRLTVEEFGTAQWADVRVYGDPRFRKRGSSEYAEWSLSLRATDPRKYGEVHDFAAGQTAIQYGNFPATPRLLVGAGSGGYTVTGPDGRRVVVTSAPSGAHEIDFATGGLFVAGVRQVGAISIYQPWTVPPGIPGVVASISGSRSLVQRVTNTFV